MTSMTFQSQSHTLIGPTLSQYLSEAKVDSKTIPTGSKALDHALSGGIKSNCIYEISGLLNSGRLQVSLSILNQYLAQCEKVLWIDTSSKLPLSELAKMTGFSTSILENNCFHYMKVDHIVQFIVLLKQLNMAKAKNSNPYSLIMVNEFPDMVHQSILLLDEELYKRRQKIDELKNKFEQDRKAYGEQNVRDQPYPSYENIPIQGASIMVRQNQLMHQILELFNSYNATTNAATILIGSMNTTSQKLLLESTPPSSQLSDAQQHYRPKRHMKTVYQPKLTPLLGEEAPWLNFLESRIVLYKDWEYPTSETESATSTYAILRFNRPIVARNLNYPKNSTIRATKKIRFRITSNGLEDIEHTYHKQSSNVVNGQQQDESFDLTDEEALYISSTLHGKTSLSAPASQSDQVQQSDPMTNTDDETSAVQPSLKRSLHESTISPSSPMSVQEDERSWAKRLKKSSL